MGKKIKTISRTNDKGLAMTEESGKKKGFLTEILLQRRNIIEVVIFTVIIALGINFISDSLPLIAGWSSIIPFYIGITLSSLSLLNS